MEISWPRELRRFDSAELISEADLPWVVFMAEMAS
jgi:hypothetical protein